MEFKLLPSTAWDLQPIVKLHIEVFLEVDPMESRLRPDGLTKKLLDDTIAKWKPDITNLDKQRWMKMVTADNTIVAYARWWIEGQDDLIDDGKPAPPRDGASADVQAAEFLIAVSEKLAMKLKGMQIKEEKFLFLAPLVTAAKYRGQGCGKALLKWGCEFAKSQGLPCYLMSRPGAKEFYLKHGFEVIGSCGGDIKASDTTGSEGGAKLLESTLLRMIWQALY